MENEATTSKELPKEEKSKKDVSKKKGESKEKQRSGKRMDDHRAVTSQRNDASVKQTIYEKLYYGFRQQNEAMKSMQIVTTPRSILLPISTRTAGFMIKFLICKFARLGVKNVNLHGLCSALYRVVLIQIEIKLSQAMRDQFSRNIGTRHFMHIDVSPEFVRAVCELGTYYCPLVNLVSSIGIVKTFGAMYIPRITKTHDCVNFYDPTVVCFSTLRECVFALSSTVTPYSHRKYFYDHCPLPNARWSTQARVHGDQVDANYPVITNADEIMPAEYTLFELRKDLDLIMDSVESIGRKFEKFIHVGGIDYSGNGNSASFKRR